VGATPGQGAYKISKTKEIKTRKFFIETKETKEMGFSSTHIVVEAPTLAHQIHGEFSSAQGLSSAAGAAFQLGPCICSRG
jgi:hypothetical protein